MSIIVQICNNNRHFSVCIAICYQPTLLPCNYSRRAVHYGRFCVKHRRTVHRRQQKYLSLFTSALSFLVFIIETAIRLLSSTSGSCSLVSVCRSVTNYAQQAIGDRTKFQFIDLIMAKFYTGTAGTLSQSPDPTERAYSAPPGPGPLAEGVKTRTSSK